MSGAIGREAIDAGGNGGKGNGGKVVGRAKLDAWAIARGEQIALAVMTALPDRSNRMDHMPRRQTVALGDFGVSGGAAVELTAYGQQFRPSSSMDRAVDTATAQQRRVGRVDDGVNAQCSNVGNDNFQARCADLARGQDQAEAAALTTTPFSASNC